jgi:hypothetical protein
MFSPMPQGLVLNKLLLELNESGYYAKGYADDIAVLINRKHP